MPKKYINLNGVGCTMNENLENGVIIESKVVSQLFTSIAVN